MNVLFVIHYPVFGGPHNQALLLTSPLTKHGVSTTVLLPDEQTGGRGNAARRLRGAGVDVVTAPIDRVRATRDPLRQLRFFSHLPRDVQAIRRVIRSRNIDLVQIGGLVNPHGAIAARLEKVPVVWQLLDTRPPMAVRRVLMPLVLGLSDVVMSTGRTVAAVHPGADGLSDRLFVFFPPVDPDRFTTEAVDRASARRNYGFLPRDRVLGTVGNINPQKGHEYLLRAAALARRSTENVKVLVVGSSHDTHRAYENGLHELCQKLRLSVGVDVVFAGGLDDVRPALAAMDVFVLASVPRSEGAPTVIQEAMMMELPVVATDVGSVREVVGDGETGFVVPPEDHHALAGAAVRLLESADLRVKFGLRARARALQRFSLEECTRVHLAAYERALARRKRPRRAVAAA